jgi:hypothetical protein
VIFAGVFCERWVQNVVIWDGETWRYVWWSWSINGYILMGENASGFEDLFLLSSRKRRPAGRAHCAWGGHFVTRVPCLGGT